MNNEKIIAGIEKYIDTLTENEKATYRQALTKFSLAENKDVKEAYPIFELVCIVQELTQEIKEQAQKETKGNSYVKRSKLITKLLEKSFREDFKKGFYEDIDGEKMKCCIIDGYYAFMLHDIDIPMYDNNFKPFTVQRFLTDYKDFANCEFDIAEIKKTLKLHKAKKEKTPCIIELDGKRYDAKYFINVVDGLGGDVKMYQSKGEKVRAAVFESENGKAILMPTIKR